VKTLAAIIFAFFMVWQPLTAKPAKATNACGALELNCVSCCCAARPPVEPKPVTPVQTRSATLEQMTLLLPTVSKVVLDEKTVSPIVFEAACLDAAGAIPLFRRDCAILI
jgi:hypothetical protein